MSHPPSPLPPSMAPLADRRSSPFNQFGDTTLTKVFVGGLAWETQRDTMRRYFEQFGEILEAVVITDKATGRSKGYGFVTFRDPEGARRACEDPTPVIDGRRANCNLASLGIRSRPTTPQHGGRFRAVSPYAGGSPGGVQVYGGTATYSQTLPYAYQQGYPYPSYGYPPYLPEYPYLPNMYNPYATPQYSSLYGAPGTLGSPTGLYPYHSFTQAPPETPGISVPQQAGYGQLPAPQLVQYANPGVSTATITSLPPFGGSATPLPVHSTGLTSDHHMSPSGNLAGAGPSPVPQFAMPGSTQQQFSAGGCSQQSSG